jgi:histidine ammonia-lyase/phenylalanine ammonia-lyase
MSHLTERAAPAGTGVRTAPPVVLDGSRLTIEDVVAVARLSAPVVLSTEGGVRQRIERARAARDEAMARGVPIYGVTTGFGDSVHRQIAPARAAELQAHLVRNLGCGTGRFAAPDVARATVLIRTNSLARGHSGVRVALIEGLLDLLTAGVTPLIPEEGSVGASGDLVPLSYVAAALTGTRDVLFRDEVVPAPDALRAAGLTPLVLEPKEALGLVNGTAFMTAFAVLAAADARRIAAAADACTAMATEVLTGITGPFAPFVHEVAKPHPGQIRSAQNVRTMLGGSQLARSYEEVVDEVGVIDTGTFRETAAPIQDKYSLRCAPQFVGVLWDTLDWVERWLSVELNSTNDNPLFDAEGGAVFSGGNFSGGHVALAMDALRTAVASVADLLDRQLELVVDEKFNRGLTPNLIAALPAGHPEEGLNHGFKGMQLACSSLTADALSRCMPTTVFSRSTECHNQDKVSMGATAARHTRDVVALTEKVVAIHLLALCQAADLRGAGGLGNTRALHATIRERVPFVATDREMGPDVATVLGLLRGGELVDGYS